MRKDGARFPLEVSVSRVDPSAGGPPLFVLVMHDMEERTRLERELRLVKDLAVSIGSAPDLHHALVGTIRRICLATGWDYGEAWIPGPGEVEVAGTASWGRPDSRLKKFAQTMRCCRFHRGQGLPGRIWTNGRPIWVGDLAALGEAEFCRSQPAREAGLCAAAGVPIVSGDTPIAALIFFLRQTGREDPRLLEAIRVAVASLGTLIRRKQAEDELDQYRHRLESMVEERTRALRESQARLGFADRLASIGTLAAGLGHDMTNVLLPVRAHLSALRAAGIRGGLGAESRKSIETVSKSVWYLQELADGLHSLAVDPDEEDGDPQGTNLGSWWSQAGIVIAKAVPRHVRVRASFPNGLPKVRVAASGLTQAVLNLVINAGQAIPPDHEQGRVRVAARVGDGCVRVCVSDNGSGMTPQVRRRAFEMFFTTKPRGRGTGLGLALVQRVADHAGGSVRITSRLGKGTTVTMILPVAAPTATS